MTVNIRLIQLTPSFKLAEFLHNDAEIPDAYILNNLYRLANRLQVVRDVINKPIIITSGYRTAAHNKAVGGADGSLHQRGMAADIIVKGMPASGVQHLLKNWSGGMGSAEMYTHLDIREKRERWNYG